MKTTNAENWCQKHLADQVLPRLLEEIDNEFARIAGEGGCLHPGCGGKLHRGDYARKPRGGPQWSTRFSFCCAEEGCRRRLTPASVRFLGRKVYAGFVVVLVAAMNHGLTPERVRRIRETVGVDRRTLEHWREWWLDTFVRSRFWKDARARFSPVLNESILPWSLARRFGVEGRQRLIALLRFLAPITLPAALDGQGM